MQTLDEKLREEFYEEFSIATHREEDGTLREFGLHQDMADLSIIFDFFMARTIPKAELVAEVEKVLNKYYVYAEEDGSYQIDPSANQVVDMIRAELLALFSNPQDR